MSSRAARYTVSVEFVRAGEKESEQYSSDRVEPGATATITWMAAGAPTSSMAGRATTGS